VEFRAASRAPSTWLGHREVSRSGKRYRLRDWHRTGRDFRARSRGVAPAPRRRAAVLRQPWARRDRLRVAPQRSPCRRVPSGEAMLRRIVDEMTGRHASAALSMAARPWPLLDEAGSPDGFPAADPKAERRARNGAGARQHPAEGSASEIQPGDRAGPRRHVRRRLVRPPGSSRPGVGGHARNDRLRLALEQLGRAST